MGAVGVLARILGPRGMLPNKKVGTVTFEVETIVADLKRGRAFFRNDKQGIVHFSVGKVSFAGEKLMENITSLIDTIVKLKPPTSKGVYLRGIVLSATMGPGIKVNPAFTRQIG